MPWRVEVLVIGETDFLKSIFTHDHVDGEVRFLTEEEAKAFCKELGQRIVLVKETRVVETQQPATYAFVNGDLKRIRQFGLW